MMVYEDQQVNSDRGNLLFGHPSVQFYQNAAGRP
jgi:hypothetical protein